MLSERFFAAEDLCVYLVSQTYSRLNAATVNFVVVLGKTLPHNERLSEGIVHVEQAALLAARQFAFIDGRVLRFIGKIRLVIHI